MVNAFVKKLRRASTMMINDTATEKRLEKEK
jgi:hypothetical protein